MSPATIRHVRTKDRQWINKELQAFCGSYQLDDASGLYFDLDVSDEHRELISQTFLKMPRALRNIAIQLGLTVSTALFGTTKYGARSAVYGAWDARDIRDISPHLEMSSYSLTPQFIMPHLVHECCHLLWAVKRFDRLAFIQEMIYLIDTKFVEVTGYAQSYFDEWQELVQMESSPGLSLRREYAQQKWAMEAFCESVAKICCPSYKSYENRYTGELLDCRRVLVAKHFGLLFDAEQRQLA